MLVVGGYVFDLVGAFRMTSSTENECASCQSTSDSLRSLFFFGFSFFFCVGACAGVCLSLSLSLSLCAWYRSFLFWRNPSFSRIPAVDWNLSRPRWSNFAPSDRKSDEKIERAAPIRGPAQKPRRPTTFRFAFRVFNRHGGLSNQLWSFFHWEQGKRLVMDLIGFGCIFNRHLFVEESGVPSKKLPTSFCRLLCVAAPTPSIADMPPRRYLF